MNKNSLNKNKLIENRQKEITRRMQEEQKKRIESGKHEIPAAIKELKHSNPIHRGRSITFLGDVPHPQSIESLLEVLKNESLAINRTYAINSLVNICSYYKIKDQKVLDSITRHLNDEDTGTALRAALALVYLGDYNTPLSFLGYIVKGKNIEQWQVNGFADIGDKVKGNERIERLSRSKKTMRTRAIFGLRKIGNTKSKLELQSSLGYIDDSDFKTKVKEGINAIKKKENTDD
jgi:HEAT repeat protein